MKFGYQGGYLVDNRRHSRTASICQYRTQNGIPDQLTQNIDRFQRSSSASGTTRSTRRNQWTLGRVTLQGALRFDHAWSWFPEAEVGGVRFLPTAMTFPGNEGRGRLQGHHAARRRRVGRVRHRQDLAQGQLRQVPRSGAERAALFVGSRPTSRLRRRRRGRGPTRTATSCPTAIC